MKRAVLVLLVAVGLGGAIHAQPPAGARQVCAPTNSEAATVAAIAGAIFGYYLTELRAEEREVGR